MTFAQAVHATPSLTSAMLPGLQALSKAARSKIDCSDTTVLVGSVDVDTTLQPDYPTAPRWDYAVGVGDGKKDRIHWIEVHPANTKNVDEVIAKLRWLKDWLPTHALALHQLRGDFIWIASGEMRILKTSPQFRRLASTGIVLRGRHRIP